MNLVLFGPPGAGKGTQSQLLVDELRLTHISTGDLLRAAMKNKTALGVEAKKYVDQGNLVPDAVMIGLIKEIMHQKKTGFLLDGFPRTVNQAEALDTYLRELGAPISKAVFLEVPRKLLSSRLTGRRVCPNCGTTFHIELHPPKKSNVCDVCGHELEHRRDDHAEVIENRLEVYEKNTAPLKKYYEDRKLFISVDGVGEPAAVLARIKKAVA